MAIVIITGIDKKLETQLIAKFNINNLEQTILEQILPPTRTSDSTTSAIPDKTSEKNIPKLALDGSTVAPWVEFPQSQWINSQPLNLNSLKGKVVVLDFWTYSCINCQRTLPYMVALDKKYRDK